MTTTVAAPAEQRLLLYNISRADYERLLDVFADRGSPRLTYDRGVLEIVSPGPEPEETHLVLGSVVSVVAEELGIEFRPVGHTTFRRPGAERGFEADASFYVGDSTVARGLVPIDPVDGPPPDLVIEVDVTHPSLEKPPIYAAVGVPEVWRHHDGRVVILVLSGDGYREVAVSSVLPMLSAADLTRLIAESRGRSRIEWLRSLRAWVRSRR